MIRFTSSSHIDKANEVLQLGILKKTKSFQRFEFAQNSEFETSEFDAEETGTSHSSITLTSVKSCQQNRFLKFVPPFCWVYNKEFRRSSVNNVASDLNTTEALLAIGASAEARAQSFCESLSNQLIEAQALVETFSQQIKAQDEIIENLRKQIEQYSVHKHSSTTNADNTSNGAITKRQPVYKLSTSSHLVKITQCQNKSILELNRAYNDVLKQLSDMKKNHSECHSSKECAEHIKTLEERYLTAVNELLEGRNVIKKLEASVNRMKKDFLRTLQTSQKDDKKQKETISDLKAYNSKLKERLRNEQLKRTDMKTSHQSTVDDLHEQIVHLKQEIEKLSSLLKSAMDQINVPKLIAFNHGKGDTELRYSLSTLPHNMDKGDGSSCNVGLRTSLVMSPSQLENTLSENSKQDTISLSKTVRERITKLHHFLKNKIKQEKKLASSITFELEQSRTEYKQVKEKLRDFPNLSTDLIVKLTEREGELHKKIRHLQARKEEFLTKSEMHFESYQELKKFQIILDKTRL